jgi:hypothetical protein
MFPNLHEYQLTLLGRSVLLIGCEIFANIACWIVAILLFRPHTGGDAGGLLSLAMLSWVCKNSTFECVSNQKVLSPDDRIETWLVLEQVIVRSTLIVNEYSTRCGPH